MNSTEISNEIVEKQKALKVASDNLSTVEIEIQKLQKQIIEIQSKKKDLEIEASRGGKIVKDLRISIKILERQYWMSKD